MAKNLPTEKKPPISSAFLPSENVHANNPNNYSKSCGEYIAPNDSFFRLSTAVLQKPFCGVQFNINRLLGFAKTAKYTFTPCIKGKCGKFDRAMAKRVSKAIFSEERKPRASKEEKEEEWSPGRGD